MLRIKKRVIPEILNLSTVLGVKGNEAGEKADFIEQNDTAGQNFANCSFCLTRNLVGVYFQKRN